MRVRRDEASRVGGGGGGAFGGIGDPSAEGARSRDLGFARRVSRRTFVDALGEAALLDRVHELIREPLDAAALGKRPTRGVSARPRSERPRSPGRGRDRRGDAEPTGEPARAARLRAPPRQQTRGRRGESAMTHRAAPRPSAGACAECAEEGTSNDDDCTIVARGKLPRTPALQPPAQRRERRDEHSSLDLG